MKTEASVDPQCGGPDWKPITPKTGSLFHAETQAYAELLSNLPDKALESANRALALRPVFGPTFEALCCCTMALGRCDEARRWGERLAEVDGPEAHFIAPMRASQPEYDKRIARLCQKATA